VNALLEATLTSVPARVRNVSAVCRTIELVATLQIASVLDPRAFASRWAAMVSAVSPDCDMTSVMVSGATMGSRYRHSLA